MPRTNPHVRPFFFREPISEVLKSLRRDLPLNISSMEALADRVSQRYPIISKSEVSMIVKGFFEVMREMLVAGRHFSLYDLMEEMKLRFYVVRCSDGVNRAALKMKLISSPNLYEATNEQ